MTKLNGKTAVVTGAASGIGKEIALTLAAQGAALTGQSFVVSHGWYMQ